MSKKMIIITDSVFFEAAEFKSICYSCQCVQASYVQKPDGSTEQKFKNQHTIMVQYVPVLDQQMMARYGNNIPLINHINVICDTKKEAKEELKAILKQVQKQRRDDAALQEVFEEYFEWNKNG